MGDKEYIENFCGKPHG